VVALGVILIYSLLLNDVQTRTYEYGMLRALGMPQKTLIHVLLTKALAFAFPAILLGLFFAFLVNVPVAVVLFQFASLPPSFRLSGSSVLLGALIGLFIPLVANIAPISRALSRTLRDSLDVYHHVVGDVNVRVQKLANLGLDLWQTCLSVLMVVVGFTTFYLVPYSFTFGKFALFLNILTAVLLGMLCGLCILAQLLQPKFEISILWLFTRAHAHLYSLVRKNLQGHRGRNQKTSLMFTLCLGFIVFAGVMLELQSQSIVDNVRQFIGADLQVYSWKIKEPLPEAPFRQFLDSQIAQRKLGDPTAMVESYTFFTFPLADVLNIA